MINKQKLYSIILVSAAMILTLVSIACAAPFAYITNQADFTVSAIDTATNNVTATVPVGVDPSGLAASPDGTKVYVTNFGYANMLGTVSVMEPVQLSRIQHILLQQEPIPLPRWLAIQTAQV
jgi:YVTN family beta-propeller protein